MKALYCGGIVRCAQRTLRSVGAPCRREMFYMNRACKDRKQRVVDGGRAGMYEGMAGMDE